MSRLLPLFFTALLLPERAWSEPVLSININMLDQLTGAANVSLFEVHPGDLVEEAVVEFSDRHSLHHHHVEELLEAVRDASLLQGQALLPLPTLILAHTSASPFAPPHGADSLHTIVLGPHLPQPATLVDVLQNATRGSGAALSNRVYALVSPDTQFRTGLSPRDLFLEFDRLRYSHTGQFSGDFVLVFSCRAHQHDQQPPPWNVIMFSSSLVWPADLKSVSSAAVVQALLESRVAYRAPPLLSRRLLTCHEVELPRGPLDVLVVVLTQGKDDPTTWGVFRDVAAVVDQGLRDLGLSSTVVVCSFLDRCGLPQHGPQWILLAPHHLASYLTEDDVPAVLTRGDLIPASTVLYNFEHIPGAGHVRPPSSTTPSLRSGSLVSRAVLDVYSRYQIWDYSRANVDRLLSHNLTATYVPLGFSDCLAIDSAADPPPLSQRQIDVLFYGTVLPRRTRIIRNLRAAGIRVVFASAANNGVFGEELDAYLVDAKLVLSLGAFDDDTEWKMTRFIKPLANRRLIVSERSSAEEQLLFDGGIVFADTDQLVPTCLHYLSHPEEAEAVAERGFRLYKEMREGDILGRVALVQALVSAKGKADPL